MNQLSVTNQIGYLTLNNPPLNCLNPEVMTDIIAKLNECDAQNVRGVVLRSGLQGVFSAGVDPDCILSTDIEGRKTVFKLLGQMINRFLALNVPVIADINGPAQAGGAVLAALADFAIIDEKHGKICFSEIKVNLSMPTSIQALVYAKVPPGKVADIVLFGKNISAREAVNLGFASSTYESNEQRDKLMQDYVNRLARLKAKPMQQTLSDLKAPLREKLKNYDADVEAEFSQFLTDEYLGKGLHAVLGKKPR